MGIRNLPHLESCFRYDQDRSNHLGRHFVLWHQQSISIIGFPCDRFYANINVLSSIDCFPVTTPGLKLEMLRMKLFAASSDICIEAVSSLIWLLRPVSSVLTGGRRLLGTERLSGVTRPGLVSCAGAGEARISPTGGEHLGGPELQPTQLQETWVRS